MEETNGQKPQFTPDLISEILLRLPLKPLARFKSVSKSWLSLINSPNFIKLYLQKFLNNIPLTSSLALLSNPNLHPNQTGPTNLLLIDPTSPDHPPSKLNLCFIQKLSPLHTDADIVSTCHGLLCISNYPSWFSIFNPITRTHEVVSFPDSKPKSDESHWVDFGFGFDHFSNDYKVVRLDQINGPHYDPKKEVSVFSLKTQSWKRVDECFPHFLCHPKGHGKYASNCLFWLTTTTPPRIYELIGLMQVMGYGDVSPYDYAIVAFDLASEKFKLFDLPEYGYDDLEKEALFLPRLSLWVLDGKDLCLMVVHGDLRSRLLDVWLFKDVGVNEKGGWRKIVYRFPWQRAHKNGTPLRPLFIRKGPRGGEELLLVQACEFYWYDLRSGSIREFKIDSCPSMGTVTFVCGHTYCYDPIAYMGSPISLDACDGGCFVVDEHRTESSCKNDKKMDDPENKKKGRRNDFLSMGFKLKL